MADPLQAVVAPGVLGKQEGEEEETSRPDAGASPSEDGSTRSWVAPWERTMIAVPSTPSPSSTARPSPATGSAACAEAPAQAADVSEEVISVQRSSSLGRSNSRTMDQMVISGASRLAGLEESSQRQVTREDLLEQGVPRQQADAYVFRIHESEVFMQNFQRWILCFSLIMLLSIPALVAISLWTCAVYWKDQDKECDVPIQFWTEVMFGIVAFNATLNRPMINGSYFVRIFCCYTRDPDSPTPTPLRVCIFNAAVLISVFIWNCIGLHWTMASGDESRKASGLPACSDVAPSLLTAVGVYCTFHMAFTIFTYLNMIGLAHLLHTAMRIGLLKTSDAAPRGSLEKNTIVVTPGDEALEEQPSCSVCLEDFGPESGEIRKTVLCGHAFHRQCLQGWLNVNRTCPLCRMNLGNVGGETASTQVPEVAPDTSATSAGVEA